MRIRFILGAFILSVFLAAAGLGIYKFNFTNEDIFLSGSSIEPEDHHLFVGSWHLSREESPFAEGFILKEDGSASSINSRTLHYKKWRIESDRLILTAVSLGNRSGSVDDEEYIIDSFNGAKLFLKFHNETLIFTKGEDAAVSSGNEGEISIPDFKYFAADTAVNDAEKDERRPPDFSSRGSVENYRLLIEEKYPVLPINFASHYVVITWGCGSGCLDGVMVDSRDGSIHDLPSTEGFSDIGSFADFMPDSILLKTGTVMGDRVLTESFWLWNESGKDFILYMNRLY